jgi:hypothetical protein
MYTYNLQDIEIIRIAPVKDGIFAYASYSDWTYEYNFFINPDGKVMGKTTSGSWLELSQSVAFLLRQKVNSRLIELSVH